MNAAGTSALATVYRLGWARSRPLLTPTSYQFWALPNASISRDGNYIAFNSNMAYPAGCSNSTVQTNIGCADLYVITAPNGNGLGLSASSPAPTSPMLLEYDNSKKLRWAETIVEIGND